MNLADTVAKRKPEKIEKISEGDFGAMLATYANGYRAVIKTPDSKYSKDPSKKFFRGIALSTVTSREIAFYELAKILDWTDIVPETVRAEASHFNKDSLPEDIVSAQQYVPSMHFKTIDPRVSDKSNPKWLEYFKALAGKFSQDAWRRLVLMDLIANSRDRHTKNIVVKFPGPHIVAVDNSITFGLTFARYRCVFHQYLFAKVFNFIPYRRKLASFKRVDFEPLAKYLRPIEVDHVFRRIEFLLEFPYRIPFETMSKGERGINDFPTYAKFFTRAAYHAVERPLVVSLDPHEKLEFKEVA